jgi:ribosomal protein S18 acetylase RimI-like enzyme
MEQFLDKDTGLSWLKYDQKHGENYIEQNDILSAWSASSNIRRYLCGPHETLDSLFLRYLGKHNDLFYCYQDADLVGATIIVRPVFGNQDSTIEYLAVNPAFQHQGIGTRMVSSITHNPQYFVGKDFMDLYSTVVDEENIPSQKMFLKNKFVPMKKPNMYYDCGFIKFYCEPRKNVRQITNQDNPEIDIS